MDSFYSIILKASLIIKSWSNASFNFIVSLFGMHVTSDASVSAFNYPPVFRAR